MNEISLKEYLERILDLNQRALELEAKPMNEFRLKTEMRLDRLESYQSNMTGRLWALGAILAISVTLILRFWR